MDVIPAIDLKGGRCVRLYQGDYDREQVFSDDPVAVALEWERQGARRLHIVDLEGARDGRPVNLEAVEAIAARAAVPLQVGGGIRDLATAQDAELRAILDYQKALIEFERAQQTSLNRSGISIVGGGGGGVGP